MKKNITILLSIISFYLSAQNVNVDAVKAEYMLCEKTGSILEQFVSDFNICMNSEERSSTREDAKERLLGLFSDGAKIEVIRRKGDKPIAYTVKEYFDSILPSYLNRCNRLLVRMPTNICPEVSSNYKKGEVVSIKLNQYFYCSKKNKSGIINLTEIGYFDITEKELDVYEVKESNQNGTDKKYVFKLKGMRAIKIIESGITKMESIKG